MSISYRLGPGHSGCPLVRISVLRSHPSMSRSPLDPWPANPALPQQQWFDGRMHHQSVHITASHVGGTFRQAHSRSSSQHGHVSSGGLGSRGDWDREGCGWCGGEVGVGGGCGCTGVGAVSGGGVAGGGGGGEVGGSVRGGRHGDKHSGVSSPREVPDVPGPPCARGVVPTNVWSRHCPGHTPCLRSVRATEEHGPTCLCRFEQTCRFIIAPPPPTGSPVGVGGLVLLY